MSGNAMERKLTGIRYPVCAVIALPGAITMPEPADPPPKREPFWSSITIKDGMTDDAKTRSLGTGAFLRTMSMIRKTSIAGAAARKKLGFAAVVSVKRSVKTKYDFGVSFLEISFSVFMYTRIGNGAAIAYMLCLLTLIFIVTTLCLSRLGGNED